MHFTGSLPLFFPPIYTYVDDVQALRVIRSSFLEWFVCDAEALEMFLFIEIVCQTSSDADRYVESSGVFYIGFEIDDSCGIRKID